LREACFSRRSADPAVWVLLGVVGVLVAAAVLQSWALGRRCGAGAGLGRLGGCSGLRFVVGSGGSGARVEQPDFAPRGSMDPTSLCILRQVGGAAPATMLLEVCSPHPLCRSTADSSIGSAGDGWLVHWRWASSDLCRVSTSAASTPASARWSLGALARSLPVRVCKQGLAGRGCVAAMAAAAARLRLVVELRVVVHLRVLLVIFCFCEVLSVGVDPL
jgi:hypothetical protein